MHEKFTEDVTFHSALPPQRREGDYLLAFPQGRRGVFRFSHENALIRFPVLLGILLLSLGLSVAIFATQEKVAWRDLWHSAAIAPPSPAPIATVELADALHLFYSSRTVIVDVREKQYYDYGHIEGALSIPFEKLDLMPAELLKKLKLASSVVVYCNAQSCGTSFLAARKLMDQGLDQVTAYTGGWGEWRSCRLPMTMSREMKEEERDKGRRLKENQQKIKS